MEDEELARIRSQRMAQLQASSGSGVQNRTNPNVQNDQQKQQQQQQQQASKEREVEMRNSILSSVLTQEARARLCTLATAKPDRASAVENMIIRNAQMGTLRQKVDEEQLKDLLAKVTTQVKRETNVKYERRRVFDEDDDDDEDDIDDHIRRRAKGDEDDSDVNE